MSPTAKQLGIDRLSIAERIILVEEIWDSIAAEEPTPELSDSLRDELDRRISAHEADPASGASWPEVKARILSRGQATQ